MYKIKAVLKSPLMIGGKTLNSNYRESKDYIPGSVLRAAYAKALVERCYYEQKNYWLNYKDEPQCKECEFCTICQRFSQLVFPALYPLGSRPYPMTAREKKYKYKEDRNILDILKSRLSISAKSPDESEWKRLEGFYKDGATVKLIHSAITRTAIDYYRNTAKEGFLYTQNVISEKYLREKSELADVEFSGEIQLSPEEEKELCKIEILHIGADITKGFGVCYMSYEEQADEHTPEKIGERIKAFNLGMKEDKQFVALDLLTDAYLGLEEIGDDSLSQTKISTKQMLIFLEEKIGLPKEKYHLYKVFKSQEILTGFDTSKNTEKEMRRRRHLVVKAGAVFVYQVLCEHIDAKELTVLEKQGIGKHTEHGFGKICICDSFHTQYDVLKGEKNG
ncbi:MAG: hypothetical protein HFH65_01300 [Lachnospiraceae bacterium]|nr:hypothetical protein [Lachnospiraceae bacterium]